MEEAVGHCFPEVHERWAGTLHVLQTEYILKKAFLCFILLAVTTHHVMNKRSHLGQFKQQLASIIINKTQPHRFQIYLNSDIIT